MTEALTTSNSGISSLLNLSNKELKEFFKKESRMSYYEKKCIKYVVEFIKNGKVEITSSCNTKTGIKNTFNDVIKILSNILDLPMSGFLVRQVGKFQLSVEVVLNKSITLNNKKPN